MAGHDQLADEHDPQRRRHVRVPMEHRCAVRMSGRRTVPSELVDMSGTGCSFRLDREVEVGDHGTIRISFDEWTLDTSFVVRFVQFEHRRWTVGVSFDALLNAEIDHIVREVFTHLRRQIRARRIVE